MAGEVIPTPAAFGDILVYESHTGVFTIENPHHFSVTYDTNSDLITVKINGLYFGRTGGLLGIYDYEPANDFTTSFGKINNQVGRFVNTWNVGTAKCQ